jgi:diazepam-binding inhibitor (GABA receptor modulator, acyl-CoA-binding protein)
MTKMDSPLEGCYRIFPFAVFQVILSTPTNLHPMSLKDEFESAQARVRTLTRRPSNEQLLILYALFKQATEGDVHGEKPAMFDFKEAAKYAAWESLKGKPAGYCMEKYVALVGELLAKIG